MAAAVETVDVGEIRFHCFVIVGFRETFEAALPDLRRVLDVL